MTIEDVVSMTLAVLDRIDIRGQENVTAMKNAMDNLTALMRALSRKEEHNDGNDRQGQDL